ncbi:MAG: S53 family peptidase [Streptosporangiaceae bacterium]
MTPRTRTGIRSCAVGLPLLLASALVVSAAGMATLTPASASPRLSAAASGNSTTLRPACPAAPFGQQRCFVMFERETSVNRAIAAGVTGAAARPKGWGARQLEQAYRLPVKRHSHATVAVSIAFDTPNLARYLAVYRKHFGLPPCTVRSGCFRKVNQTGKARPLPPSGVRSGWDLEATLDVSMISAACPHCKILVVEANSPDFPDLAKTENTAARLGAQVISNSYGARETGFSLKYAKAYEHRGHVITASTGDFGYTAASFPADLPRVTAIGGTVLSRVTGHRGWSEKVWNVGFAGAGGSGCSAYTRKPSWQHDKACPGRTVADVAAVAWNIAIFNKNWGGWVRVGGTSVSAPLIAGVYGLAGNASSIRPGFEYQHKAALFDVSHGNNAWFDPQPKVVCGNSYLCVARKGYDAPTGLGTPDGIGAF